MLVKSYFNALHDNIRKQSLQYLNFINEQKVLSYALKQGIWRVAIANVSAHFSKIEKMKGRLSTLSP